jgi:PucR C-terminal helix-turn-helix domain
MLPELERVAEEMIEAIQGGVPEYARPLDDAYRGTVRRAVTHAIGQFVERIANPAAPRKRTAEMFREIGRIEAAEGRNLEPLQMALRLGARVAWRSLCAKALDEWLDADVLARVGEAIFLYLDELAGACAEGFTSARAEVVGELERRRRRLLNLVVADPPASPDAIAELARAARWTLPRRVAIVALRHQDNDYFGPLPPLPPDVIMDTSRDVLCLLVPDPDGPGRAQMIERGLRGWTGAIGPAVPLARASRSLRWARQALALTERGIPSFSERVVRCADHLGTLVIFSDEELARALSAARLVPFQELRPPQRDILAETLLSWLQNGGNAKAVARQLHIHPQTARYRLRQLQSLFGETLDDPDSRFELEIALRARRLLGAASSQGKGSRPASGKVAAVAADAATDLTQAHATGASRAAVASRSDASTPARAPARANGKPRPATPSRSSTTTRASARPSRASSARAGNHLRPVPPHRPS